MMQREQPPDTGRQSAMMLRLERERTGRVREKARVEAGVEADAEETKEAAIGKVAERAERKAAKMEAGA